MTPFTAKRFNGLLLSNILHVMISTICYCVESGILAFLGPKTNMHTLPNMGQMSDHVNVVKKNWIPLKCKLQTGGLEQKKNRRKFSFSIGQFFVCSFLASSWDEETWSDNPFQLSSALLNPNFSMNEQAKGKQFLSIFIGIWNCNYGRTNH